MLTPGVSIGGEWLVAKFMRDAADVGIRQAAARMRKWGMPIQVTLAIMRGALAGRPVEIDPSAYNAPKFSEWFPVPIWVRSIPVGVWKENKTGESLAELCDELATLMQTRREKDSMRQKKVTEGMRAASSTGPDTQREYIEAYCNKHLSDVVYVGVKPVTSFQTDGAEHAEEILPTAGAWHWRKPDGTDIRLSASDYKAACVEAVALANGVPVERVRIKWAE